jgi:hypothetical protein
VNDVSDL